MTTAKDLAFKAFRDGIKHMNPDYVNDHTMPSIKERFENWWSEWVIRKDHQDSFEPKHNVYVDGNRYIQSE